MLATSSLTVTLKSSAGHQAYSGTASLQLTTPVGFTSAQLETSSTKNGALNTFTFHVVAPTAVLVGDFFRVTLPSSMAFDSGSPLQCAGTAPLAGSLACSLTGDVLYVSVGSSDDSSQF